MRYGRIILPSSQNPTGRHRLGLEGRRRRPVDFLSHFIAAASGQVRPWIMGLLCWPVEQDTLHIEVLQVDTVGRITIHIQTQMIDK